MNPPVARVLTALAGHDIRACGSGWIARCPAHDDRHASLAIGEGEDGRALLHCHRGCDLTDVLRALGLTMRDLFARPSPRTVGHTAYDYRDGHGDLLFQVVRITIPGGKRFTQRRPDGCGGWIWAVGGTPRVLYRLPELLATDSAETVFVVEGEKDADSLARLGLTATTNPGGAGKWRREHAAALLGRRVVILPDNDPPGIAHSQDVARSLAGVAATLRVVDLPGLAEKGDVTDWLTAGHTVDDLRALVLVSSLGRTQ